MTRKKYPPNHPVSALQTALSGRYVQRAFVVAVLVGTILNAINQGDVIVAGDGVAWLKFALTYCVPFCVSTFASWTAIMENGQRND